MRQKATLRKQRAVLQTGCVLALACLIGVPVGWAAASHGHWIAREIAATEKAAAPRKAPSTSKSLPARKASPATSRSTQHAPGYLGIEFHDLTKAQAAAMHLRGPCGVEVLLVDHDGPAAEAGLEPHDLITGLNGHIVASGEALRRMIHDAGAGAEVKLSVFRNGVPVTLHARLANREMVEKRALERVMASPSQRDETVLSGFSGNYVADPPNNGRSQNFISSILHAPPFTGLVLGTMHPQLANFFGAPGGVGLLVQEVDANSPASAAGLHAGDVILRMGGMALRSESQWNKQLYALKGRAVSLLVLRDHHELALTLQPDPKRRP